MYGARYLHIPDTSVDAAAAEAAAAAKIAAKQPITAIPTVMSAAERKAAAVAKAEALEQRKLEVSSTVCEYYQKGQCLAGWKCRYRCLRLRRLSDTYEPSLKHVMSVVTATDSSTLANADRPPSAASSPLDSASAVTRARTSTKWQSKRALQLQLRRQRQ